MTKLLRVSFFCEMAGAVISPRLFFFSHPYLLASSLSKTQCMNMHEYFELYICVYYLICMLSETVIY